MTQIAVPSPIEALHDRSTTLTRTVWAVEELEKAGSYSRTLAVGISSNVTIPLLGVFLRKHALLHGVRINVHLGNHDDLLGDADDFVRQGIEILIVHSYFDNLLPSFESQVGHLSPAAIEQKRSEVRSRYRLAFEKAKSMRAVYVTGFHRMSGAPYPTHDVVQGAIAKFNQAIAEEGADFPNVRVIDADDIIRSLGCGSAFDNRFYFRQKAPYAPSFLNELARRLSLMCRGFGGYYYKVLVLDCDNTLWGGLIGEDLLDGIKIDPNEYPGNVFWRVQNELAGLQRDGVLLCLCSKNNLEDVDQVLSRHPCMVLKERHFILKKVNWSDKALNLREIAQHLNLGLDSLVYLDDSDFECAAMRTQLPMVKTVQVPTNLADYPCVVDEIKALFLGGGVSNENQLKTDQYRQHAQAEESRITFATNEEFLASLGLRIEISRDLVSSASRISELTMKSNQFNVTSRRYSTAQICGLMASADCTIYSLVISDKFGNAGLTGVLIIQWDKGFAHVDSFLLSCRVIGRGVEFAIWNTVIGDAVSRGCDVFRARYQRTEKNALVREFFDRLGMRLVEEGEESRCYEVAVTSFRCPDTPWIEVLNNG